MDMKDDMDMTDVDVYTIEFRGDVINTYMTIIYKKNNIIHRDEELPAIINSYYDNTIRRIWYKGGFIYKTRDTDRMRSRAFIGRAFIGRAFIGKTISAKLR